MFWKISKPLFAGDLFTYEQRINFKGKNVVLSYPRKIANIFNYHSQISENIFVIPVLKLTSKC